MIQFKCTNCGQGFNVPDKYAGKRVKCKKCDQVNAIPNLAPEDRTVSSSEMDMSLDFMEQNVDALRALLKHEKEYSGVEKQMELFLK